MVRKMIGVALVTLLFAGPAAVDGWAQSSGTMPTTDPAAAPQKPAKMAPKHRAARHAVKHEAAAPAPAAEEGAPVGGLSYPPCSRTVKDQCIQLWQRNLTKAYPQCAKVKTSGARAACIEDAYKQTKS